MNKDQFDIYDRNIRLWGKENQNKLNKSKVLLINLNSVIVELAKNLILSGMNLYFFDKDERGDGIKISEEDVNNNFFLNCDDIGKERALILKERLIKINTLISIEVIDDVLSVRNDVKYVCVGFSSFTKIVKSNLTH